MRPARAAAVVTGALVGVGFLVGLTLLVHDARTAQRSLDRAKLEGSAVLVAVRHNDVEKGEEHARRLRLAATTARNATSGWLWAVAGHVPLLGRTPRSVATVASVTAELSDTVLPRLLDTERTVSAHPLMHGNRVDLARLQSVGATLDAVSRQLHTARLRLDRLDMGGVLGPVRKKAAAVRARLDALDERMAATARLATTAPALLGAAGPRRYLVVLQNNAEARGTGGLAGAYLVLEADAGTLRVVSSGTDDDFNQARAPLTQLGPGYRALYGVDAALWTNANLSPHFPDAASLWLASWRQVRHTALDGVVAVDPVTLGRLLAVTGPVRLPAFGEIRADNAVTVTERDVYLWFAHDNRARQRFLLAALGRIVDRVLGYHGQQGPRLLLALVGAANEGRLIVYSAHPPEQGSLRGMGWTGELPAGPAPFARLTVDNASGTKLDLYLRRTVSYALGPCSHGVRTSTVTVTLTSDVPAVRLPPYVVRRHDVPASLTAAPLGSNRLLVYLHLTRGAGLDDATLDGRRIAVNTGNEQGHPVVALSLDLDRGQTRTLVLRLVEPATAGAPTVPVQPLAQPQHTTVVAAACRLSG